ncbi:hypothetical protein EYF80_054885 [Liparis tanakae]|uniref:Uncharacterized protein n=1 Tax=Liparis tanakae TaxID=230148 RepID=A0A4Z2F1D5_9TELE|nr:hypothetical protein EYF80_054885 [Liparis tanakae]
MSSRGLVAPPSNYTKRSTEPPIDDEDGDSSMAPPTPFQAPPIRKRRATPRWLRPLTMQRLPHDS